ncbi:hypothetical protein SDC9_78048 [bioreactor metagenome]|uniref:Uncharacterized protein n=1 Tax=bioreactor metagenome TaxID=1076179 RepID=A0A644YYE7_9ZZZZ
MGFFPNHAVQVLLGVFKARRVQVRRQKFKALHAVRHGPGVGHHDLICLIFPQIGKLLQHFVGGLKVDGKARVGVRKLLRRQQNVAVYLVLRLPEVDVASGADGLSKLLAKPHDGSVQLPQILLRLHVAVAQHK